MSDEIRHSFLPYCLDRQPDGRYAVLNRRYKPVGLTTTDHVTYTDYPCLVKLKGLTAARAVKMSARGDDHLHRIYLYNDGCVPTAGAAEWSAYAKRLQVLAKLSVED